jgi:hypothetical protein
MIVSQARRFSFRVAFVESVGLVMNRKLEILIRSEFGQVSNS